MHASQEPHVKTFACAMHTSQVTIVETFAHSIHASHEPHAKTSAHPLVLDIRDDVSSKLDQVLDLIFESKLDDIEHADDKLDQRPKWTQSILPMVDYLIDDIVNPRRTRS
jgi:hypothetical protein